MNASEKLYRNIDAEKSRNGFTDAKIAEMLGIKERAYRKRKENRSSMTADDLVALSTMFNCSVDYLLGISNSITKGE